jgi:hypothetical protein
MEHGSRVRTGFRNGTMAREPHSRPALKLRSSADEQGSAFEAPPPCTVRQSRPPVHWDDCQNERRWRTKDHVEHARIAKLLIQELQILLVYS